MTSPAVLLDACTLVPIGLSSCLLSLAEAGLLTPLWSDEILDEVERNLPKLKGMTVDKAKRRVDAMRAAFDDEASVGDYQSLVPQLECRHLLAAAIIGGADVLLTFNVKDFPGRYPASCCRRPPDAPGTGRTSTVTETDGDVSSLTRSAAPPGTEHQ